MKNRLAIVLSLASPEFTEHMRGLPPLDRRINPWEARKLAPYLAFVVSMVDGELLCAKPCDAAELRVLVHEERGNVGKWVAAHTAEALITNTLQANGPHWGTS
jgi:hypothetical protein